jgi:hypothetical protein
MGAKTLAWQISTALVILLFGFSGTVKVTPAVSPDMHNDLVRSPRHTNNIYIILHFCMYPFFTAKQVQFLCSYSTI